ncbi:Xaa-Pro aminopeptidase [Hibiscus syriacus]|uniref:Xaa-Pro aminopeptidase n=1 Tax=Hibiscus syriacus TaxID=106335 RepID=A0A6A2ZPC6_HIBSY|nr:Xaa-Pro aminopeptidase [Hibiscus syriacus]
MEINENMEEGVNVLFVATFVSVLIFSVVAAAIAAHVVTALAGALSVLIGSVGRWCNFLGSVMRKSRLEIKIESLLQTANFALGQEDALKLAMDEIKRKLGEFMEIIEKLGQQADKCSHDIRMARAVIFAADVGHSSTSTIGEGPWELQQ